MVSDKFGETVRHPSGAVKDAIGLQAGAQERSRLDCLGAFSVHLASKVMRLDGEDWEPLQRCLDVLLRLEWWFFSSLNGF